VTSRERGDGFNTEIAEIAENLYLGDLGDLCVERRLRVLPALQGVVAPYAGGKRARRLF